MHFLQILSVWKNWFDLNHQLEFSGARVKYLDLEKGHTNVRLYRISEKKPLIISHYGASRETRCLKVVRGLLQPAYFVYAKSESPGEVMRACRLVRAFSTCRCNKNHDHFMC